MIVNDCGRKWDDFDALKMHVDVMQLIANQTGVSSSGYSVVGSDGTPLVGFVPDDKSKPIHSMTCPKWATV